MINILQHDEDSDVHLLMALALIKLDDERGLITVLQSPYYLESLFKTDLKYQAAEKLEAIGTETALEAVRIWRESQADAED